MIAVDTNVLVHTHRRESRQHDAAVSILREQAVFGAWRTAYRGA